VKKKVPVSGLFFACTIEVRMKYSHHTIPAVVWPGLIANWFTGFIDVSIPAFEPAQIG